MNLELIAAFKNRQRAHAIAKQVHGIIYCDDREDIDHLPFGALVSAQTDNLTAFADAADVGAYLVCRREIKPRQSMTDSGSLPGVIGLFTLVANPELGHDASDQHWRDMHAPLAVKVHKAMSFYSQLSIMHTFHGPRWDGFALCGFDSMTDLRERFFDSAEGEKRIHEDVAVFSDSEKSPRRIIATEVRFG